MLLLIVVPASIGLVIIVAIIVAVLVCLCCMRSANHHKRWEKSHSRVRADFDKLLPGFNIDILRAHTYLSRWHQRQ